MCRFRIGVALSERERPFQISGALAHRFVRGRVLNLAARRYEQARKVVGTLRKSLVGVGRISHSWARRKEEPVEIRGPLGKRSICDLVARCATREMNNPSKSAGRAAR